MWFEDEYYSFYEDQEQNPYAKDWIDALQTEAQKLNLPFKRPDTWYILFTAKVKLVYYSARVGEFVVKTLTSNTLKHFSAWNENVIEQVLKEV